MAGVDWSFHEGRRRFEAGAGAGAMSRSVATSMVCVVCVAMSTKYVSYRAAVRMTGAAGRRPTREGADRATSSSSPQSAVSLEPFANYAARARDFQDVARRVTIGGFQGCAAGATRPGIRSREAQQVRDVALEDGEQACDGVAFEGEVCWERGAQYLCAGFGWSLVAVLPNFDDGARRARNRSPCAWPPESSARR
jgi:hypothetical protein